MAVNIDQDTEFNDALRKHGIIPHKPDSRSPSPELDDSKPSLTSRLNARLDHADDDDEGADSLDDVLGEDAELDDELPRALLERYAAQRLADAQGKAQALRRNVAGLKPISKADYKREVTDASMRDIDAHDGEQGDGDDDKQDSDDDDDEPDVRATKARRRAYRGRGTGVVCYLYKDSVADCRILGPLLEQISQMYPATHFVAIVSDQCIERYPDRNVPTLLLYRKGDLVSQIVGLGMMTRDKQRVTVQGAFAHHTSLRKTLTTTLADIEQLLLQSGVLDAELKDTAAAAQLQRQQGRSRRDDSSDDDDGGGSSSFGRTGLTNTRSRGAVRISNTLDDDFDL